jgi:hypothetical protein
VRKAGSRPDPPMEEKEEEEGEKNKKKFLSLGKQSRF